MPAGVAAPPPQSLEEIGVQDLLDAALPPPSDPSWQITPLIYSGAFDTIADPRPDAFDKTGVWEYGHDLAFLNHIHVIPRRKDMGLVLSEQDVEVEVWNAYLNRAMTLDEITSEGPAGVEVIDHLGQPAHYPGSDSQIYSIKVLAEGDPNIDNLITWAFLMVDSAATNIRLLGFRLIPYSFDPNMQGPITETYGYMTDIITAFSAMEQRIQLRDVPIGTISYSVLLLTSREAQLHNSILFGNQARALGVARWQFRTPLTVAAVPDDTEIFCDTTDIPFEAGGLVFLWTDAFAWEAQTIQSIQSDRLVLEVGLQQSWPVGTVVVPMVPGRLNAEENETWESLSIVSANLTFNIDGFKP